MFVRTGRLRETRHHTHGTLTTRDRRKYHRASKPAGQARRTGPSRAWGCRERGGSSPRHPKPLCAQRDLILVVQPLSGGSHQAARTVRMKTMFPARQITPRVNRSRRHPPVQLVSASRTPQQQQLHTGNCDSTNRRQYLSRATRVLPPCLTLGHWQMVFYVTRDQCQTLDGPRPLHWTTCGSGEEESS